VAHLTDFPPASRFGQVLGAELLPYVVEQVWVSIARSSPPDDERIAVEVPVASRPHRGDRSIEEVARWYGYDRIPPTFGPFGWGCRRTRS
jgi:phenylalanyl-tRNA synthetase beta subunit